MKNLTKRLALTLSALVLASCATSDGRARSVSGSSSEAPQSFSTAPEGSNPRAWGKGDDDKDGVLNRDDKCPDSRPGQIIVWPGCLAPAHGFRLWVSFDLNSASLGKDKAGAVSEYAAMLSESKGRVEVVGQVNRCELGSGETLVDRRIEAVVSELIAHGVSPSQIVMTKRSEPEASSSSSPTDGCGGDESRGVAIIPA